MESVSLKLAPLEQGKSGGHTNPKMPRFIALGVMLYQKLKPEGVLGPLNLHSVIVYPIKSQVGILVGTWTPAVEALEGSSSNEPYFCVLVYSFK